MNAKRVADLVMASYIPLLILGIWKLIDIFTWLTKHLTEV